MAEKIRRDYGQIVGTLFRYGSLTPLRDLFISSKRKDPRDQGNYDWVERAEFGLLVGFWDNSRFSDWIKGLWANAGDGRERLVDGKTFRLVKEGRFFGVAVDALDTPRVSSKFLDWARKRHTPRVVTSVKENAPSDCRSLFMQSVRR